MVIEINTVQQNNDDNVVGKTLADLLKDFPKEFQDFIINGEFERNILEIEKIHSLKKEDVVLLENEVLQVLLTINSESEFVQNMFDNLSLDKEEIDLILKDIEGKIFTLAGEKIWPKASVEIKTNNKALNVTLEDFEDEILLIGKKGNLHLDEIEIIRKEIGKIISGKTPSNKLSSEIRKKTSLDDEKISLLIKDINSEIFERIRQSMGYKSKEEDNTDVEKLDRAQILKEIEEEDVLPPTPIKETASVQQKVSVEIPEDSVGGNKDFLSENIAEPEIKKVEKKEEKKENVPTQAAQVDTPSVNNDVFEDKLSRPVLIESEKKESTESTLDEGPDKEAYKGRIDPYREIPE